MGLTPHARQEKTPGADATGPSENRGDKPRGSLLARGRNRFQSVHFLRCDSARAGFDHSGEQGLMTQPKYVYFFGSGKAEGGAAMKDLLGGKGANLAEMTNIGLPVPAGFTITTEVCNYFYAHGNTYPPELKAQVADALRRTEEAMGAKFG